MVWRVISNAPTRNEDRPDPCEVKVNEGTGGTAAMTEMDKVKIDAVFEVLQAKIKGILSKYIVLCGKVYDFFAMLCRGQRTHTPETLAASQKRGTWIVSLLVAFVVFGALIDDDKVAEGTEERSVESTVAKDASQSNDCNAKMTTDEPLVPEKLTGWIKLPKNVNANISLRNASSPNFKPVKGNVYIHIGAGLKVGQFDGKTAFAHPVNDGLSALANLDAAFSGNAGGINDNDDDHMLAIIARDEYASGEQVRAGAYEYIGVDTYKTVLDANVSLRVFKELPEGKSKEIMNAVISNRKLLNAEYDRREKVKEAASKAAEMAKESARIKAFEEMFTAERFDNFIGKVLKSRVVIQRSEQSRLGPLSCRIIDNLRSLAAKGDWRNFCSTIERQTRTMSSKYGTATADECWGNMKLGLDMMGLQANGASAFEHRSCARLQKRSREPNRRVHFLPICRTVITKKTIFMRFSSSGSGDMKKRSTL